MSLFLVKMNMAEDISDAERMSDEEVIDRQHLHSFETTQTTNASYPNQKYAPC